MDNEWSVGEFLAVTNQILENAFPSVRVFGEISQLNIWRDRLVFFDLKEGDSVLNCMVPLASLGPVEEGMEVSVVAVPRVTTKGKFSLNVRKILPKGEGAMRRQFDLLKAKLEKEGLFAPERKRFLPFPPKTIGLITAQKSAAFADFTKIIDHRWPGLQITVADVQVQGETAENQLISAIEYFNQTAEPPEVLVLTRGGGSTEDLLVFNSESLVRAIAGSRIPTMVAIGHESDISLAELVADVRASTPSNAAEMLVPDKKDYLERVRAINLNLTNTLNRIVKDTSSELVQTRSKLNVSIERLFHLAQEKLTAQKKLINLLNPENALKNGYAILRQSGKPLSASAKLKVGDQLQVDTLKQSLTAKITSVKRRET